MLVSQTYITTLGFVHRLQELNSDSQPLIHWSILPALKTGLEDFILKCVFLIFFIDNSFIVLSQYLDSCFIVFFFLHNSGDDTITFSPVLLLLRKITITILLLFHIGEFFYFSIFF